MKSIITAILLITVVQITLYAQVTLRGKVTDVNGESVIGAIVYLKSNKNQGTYTDFEGNFSFKISEKNNQVIVISSIGYNLINDSVELNKSLIIKNYVLNPAVTSINEVVVKAKSGRSSDMQMESIKKLSSVTIDFISSETIRKTGDVNVASAVARVTGVSTNSGGLITVRGAGDRYIKTSINGSRIPTLDPFSNNIKLDLFPSSLIDNITITKTARPDLPSDWAGAYLSVDTKEYPDSLQISVESSFGYNSQVSFKEYVITEKSNTDWLGFDNSFREHNHKISKEYTLYSNMTRYDEFKALGLDEFIKKNGLNSQLFIGEENELTSSTILSDFTKLGFIELGLLTKADVYNNNTTAISNAIIQYNTIYKPKAYKIINNDAINSSQSFKNNWSKVKRKAPLNYSQSFSIGNQTLLFGRPLGYIFGFRYSSTVQNDPNSSAFRYKGDSNDSIPQVLSKETNNWSALVNIAYKPNKNNNFSVMFMPNVLGANNYKTMQFYNSIEQGLLSNEKEKKEYYEKQNKYNYFSNFYESRKQLIYQIKTEHYIPTPKIKIELNASYTNGTSNAPDFKKGIYLPDTVKYFLNNGSTGASRIYRYLTENVLDLRLSAEMPIGNQPALVRKVKIGSAYQNEYRKRDQYYYRISDEFTNSYSTASNNLIRNAHPTANPYGIDRFAIDTVFNRVQQYYYFNNQPAEHIFGESTIQSLFAMLDYTVVSRIRISGGLRIEKTNMYTDCSLFNQLAFKKNDARRESDTGDPEIGSAFINPGQLNELSYLPSANVILKLKKDELAPINLRLNFSKTVARPSLQELSDILFFDFESNAYVRGNSALKMVKINNYDVRLESYFKNGDNISVSFFYKDFENHIELTNVRKGYFYVNNLGVTWLKGIEIEGKKEITSWLDFRANITLVKSESPTSGASFDNRPGSDVRGISIGKTGRTMPMFGQAPYIINAMLNYNSKKMGLNASINYNIQGSRLVIIGDYNPLRSDTAGFIPDVYEMPRHLVDFKISKNLGKHFIASIKINDVLASVKFWKFKNLNTDITREYKAMAKIPAHIYDRYSWGTTFVAALAYKF